MSKTIQKIARNHTSKLEKQTKRTVRVTIPLTRNSEVLYSFCLYCKQNPSERFYQAIRNWSGYGYIKADGEDTFYWEGRND